MFSLEERRIMAMGQKLKEIDNSLFRLTSVSRNIYVPLTSQHARQIQVIGWLFVADFFLGFSLSPGFASILHGGNVDVGYVSESSSDYPALPLDSRSIVGAAPCFILSLVWRYAILLQRETDDLI